MGLWEGGVRRTELSTDDTDRYTVLGTHALPRSAPTMESSEMYLTPSLSLQNVAKIEGRRTSTSAMALTFQPNASCPRGDVSVSLAFFCD